MLSLTKFRKFFYQIALAVHRLILLIRACSPARLLVLSQFVNSLIVCNMCGVVECGTPPVQLVGSPTNLSRVPHRALVSRGTLWSFLIVFENQKAVIVDPDGQPQSPAAGSCRQDVPHLGGLSVAPGSILPTAPWRVRYCKL